MVADPSMARIVDVDDRISLADAEAVARGRARLRLAPAARARCAASHDRLKRVLAEGRHVYGLTTGFGPLANRLVDPADARLLQQNLVHHLASGVGPILDWAEARAMVLARLMSVLQGWSGASAESIDALCRVLDAPLAPAIPARGTVGASGDLTPLAHLVLCLQGRGAFVARDGTPLAGGAALDRIGIAPLTLAHRDGLALVNGTSAMSGIACLNARAARRAVAWGLSLTAALCEVLSGRSEAWHPAFSVARPHPGQRQAAEALRRAIAGSGWTRDRPLASRRLSGQDGGTVEAEAGQDAYTLRCAPQVLGAVLDTLDWHDAVVERELNAATDNPIFPDPAAEGPSASEIPPALHGGNFMGQPVALVSDALSNAVVVAAGLAERQIARLTDETLNRGLPAFLHRGAPGLNSGFMGAQVTASALLAEMRATCAPAAAQSISTNAANQDVVSMGTVAARLAARHLSDLARIEAILALAVAQAIDLRCEAPAGGAGPSPAARALRDEIRRISPPLRDDRPLGAEIEALAERISRRAPPPVPG